MSERSDKIFEFVMKPLVWGCPENLTKLRNWFNNKPAILWIIWKLLELPFWIIIIPVMLLYVLIILIIGLVVCNKDEYFGKE